MGSLVRVMTMSLSLVQRDTCVRTGTVRFRVFSVIYLRRFGPFIPWEIFILLCLSAFLCRQGELSLILHNSVRWFSQTFFLASTAC